MKKIIIFLILSQMVTVAAEAQTWGTENLYQTYKGEKGVISLSIPGFVMRFAANIAELEGPEDQLLRSIRSLRILTIEDADRFPDANFVKESRMSPGKKGYQLLVSVSNEGEDVMILGKEKHGKLKSILILVGGEENVLVHVKGRLNADMLGSIAAIAEIDDLEVLSQM